MIAILETPNGNEVCRKETINLIPVIRVPVMNDKPTRLFREYEEIEPTPLYEVKDYYVYRVDRDKQIAYYRERTR